MPRADMMPAFDSELEEVPCRTNPLGVKGIGESGTIGAPPAVINAHHRRAQPLGVNAIDMPATPARACGRRSSGRGAPSIRIARARAGELGLR